METELRIHLDTEDGIIECDILSLIDYKHKQYVVLLPLDDSGEPVDDKVYIYEMIPLENGKDEIINIADKEVYKEVYRRYRESCVNF